MSVATPEPAVAVPSGMAGESFAAVHHGTGIIGPDQFEELLDFIGRVDRPALLHDAWLLGRIEKATLTALIGQVWSMAEYPDRALEPMLWRWLFDAAGFTVDGVPAERPAGPVELWRGTVPERRRDWSWTTDRAVAERFAFGHVRGRPDGRLYRVLAPSAALLCGNTERGEAEYVLDTCGLRIVEVAG